MTICAISVQVHSLSWPINVVDKDGIPAMPGDLLSVEICNLGLLPGHEWGYTATFDGENGGRFLTDHFPRATKAIWYFEEIYAYSPQIPGVRFPGLTHPGIIGTAPLTELLEIWNTRERESEETGHGSLKLGEVLHQRPLANFPKTEGCHLGLIKKATPEWEKIRKEAARTIPGRENGGNCDIKNLSRANFSTGDMHFSQGDGEVSFYGAIEFMRMVAHLIHWTPHTFFFSIWPYGCCNDSEHHESSGGMEYLTPMGATPLHVNPIFEIGPVEPRFSEWLVFEGISVDGNGKQHYLDATVAYKRAVLSAIDYLSKFGYSKEQCGCCYYYKASNRTRVKGP
ncbi:hypothetical protein ACLOJK_035945 [Asimina triloba]